MNKIGKREIELLYDMSEKCYDGKITRKKALDILEGENINRSSAFFHLSNYTHLVNGEVFKRAMSALAVSYYLEKILETKGEDVLQKALQSLSLHLDYYEKVTGTKVKKRREILDEYRMKYGQPAD